MMSQLALNEKQVLKLLNAIHFCLQGAQFESIDTICYGGDAAAAGAKERGIQEIYNAVPKPIWNEFYRRARKEQADKLRKQADAIERGEETEEIE